MPEDSVPENDDPTRPDPVPGWSARRPTPPKEIDELVARCIESMETEGEDGVARVCAEHPDLAEEVRVRLASLRRRGLLLERPRAGPGGRIGPYFVLGELGAGGMGAVYLAEQREPVHRRVALKVVRAGMDSDEIVRRFAAERQALALMNHPSIAKVLDAGSTATGRPYFVMEYVAGLPITTYCDRKRLSTEARLGLFIRVCAAVQHAHQKAIVHRDLKPSNILVADQDGAGTPKVIDFGISKAIGPRLTVDSPLTLPGQVIGTLEYMSPEQAETGGHDVDTRTDVYSLGVVMYELLCGEVPFRFPAHSATPLSEVLRILRDDSPPPPSARVRNRSAGTTQGTDAPALSRRLSGELDWIVMRALEKDRNRRYASVQALADDVQRHLDDEPVVAGPPSAWYRLRKFVRRHRAPVAGGASVLVLLVAGLAVSTAFYFEARDSAERARTARDRESAALAETRTYFGLARDAVQQMLVRVGGERLAHLPHLSELRRDLLLEAREFYQGLLDHRGSDPNLRAETVSALNYLGTILGDLGETRQALEALEEGLALVEALVTEDPEFVGYHVMWAKLLVNHSTTLRQAGREADAVAAMRAADARFQRAHVLAAAQGRPFDRVDEATNSIHLGMTLAEEAPQEARAALTSGIDLLQAARVEGTADDGEVALRMAMGRSHLGAVLNRLGEVEAAEASHRAAIESMVENLATHGDRTDRREALADMRDRLALFLRNTSRTEEAEAAQRQALADWDGLRQGFPAVPRYRSSTAFAHRQLAQVLQARHRPSEARQHYEQAIATQQALVTDHPDRPGYAEDLAASCINLAVCLANEVFADRAGPDDATRALTAARRAAELFRALPGEQRQGIDALEGQAVASQLLGALLDRAGDPETEEHQRGALETFEELVRRQPRNADYRDKLANAQVLRAVAAQGRVPPDVEAARLLLQRAVEHLDVAREINPESRHLERKSDAALWRLAVATAGYGDHLAAAALAERLLERSDSPEADRLVAGVLVDCATCAPPETAAAYRERADDLFERSLQGWSAVAAAAGGLDPAQRSSIDVARAETHAAYARLLRGDGRAAAAREQLEAALEHHRLAMSRARAVPALRDGARGAFTELIDACLDDSEVARAAALARDLAVDLPDDAQAQWTAARSLARAGADAGEILGLLRRCASVAFVAPIPPRKDPAFAPLHAHAEFAAIADALAGESR